jgi:hypothetical protein
MEEIIVKGVMDGRMKSVEMRIEQENEGKYA